MVVLHALDKKLLRDFRRLWAQGIAIALVLGAGVAVMMMSVGMSGALEETRATYYERNRFADVFADVKRAPLTLLPEIRALPGVWAAEPRVEFYAVLDIPGRTRSATGHIISLPASGEPPVLNVPILRSGDWPDPQSATQVVVNEPFALANHFQPGDTFTANLNGRKRELTITGTALSPEFIYTIGPGSLMPDNESFAIIWMPDRAASAALGTTGAFSQISLKLNAGAEPAELIDRLERVLEPYGGDGAYGREDQVSHAFLDSEIQQLRAMAYVLPPVFLGITIFLVNMVMVRIVQLERAEVGLLKALGYSDAAIAVHYVMLGALIAVLGVMIGWGLGAWLSRAMARLYAEYYTFPFLILRVSYSSYAISGGLGLLAATAGAVKAALGAASLPPAVAMSPPAPPHFRRGLADIVFGALRLSQPTMMVVRSITRWPVRSGLTALGLALATAILVASNFFQDSLALIIDSAFHQSNRQDAMLLFSEELPESVLASVARLPGVTRAEGQLYLSARIRHGHLMRQTPVEGRRPGTDLSRIVDAAGRRIDAPPGGIVLSERLAEVLDLKTGDLAEVEFLGLHDGTYMVPVSAIIPQYFGLGAYMDLDTLSALFRQAPRIAVANVALDATRTEEFHAALKDVPRLAGTIMMQDNRRSFEATIQENVLIINTVYAILGIIITVGVAYNGARIQLSERARELASLRILGFTRGEVSYVLMGETMLLALIAQPVGWWIGHWVARFMSEGFESDLYTVPLVLNTSTFAYASLVTLSAALAAALVVRRRIDRLDLVQVLKTRE